jgi:hypothetical protein
MFVELERLSVEADARYASDDELDFIYNYIQSFNIRNQTYLNLQVHESEIIDRVYTKLRSLDPNLLKNGSENISEKWRRDTSKVLKYVALTVLINDSEYLKSQLLIWFQTIMQAFNAERSCNATYDIMQQIVKQVLEPEEAALVSPILELNRSLLGNK